MDAVKIIRIIALLLVIGATFADIPYAALGLAVLGLLNGFLGVPTERRVTYLVTALALAMSVDALDMVPAVGGFLTSLFANLSAVLNAGVLAVMVMIVKDRLTTDP